MARLRRWYGASPWHLLLMAGVFALAAYAGVRLLGGGAPWGIAVWFAGAALLHDLVLVPAYSLADRVLRFAVLGRGSRGARTPAPAPESYGAREAREPHTAHGTHRAHKTHEAQGPRDRAHGTRGDAGRAARVAVLDHVRVPAVASALLLLVYLPLVLGPSDTYVSKTGLTGEPFGARWLLVGAALFAASAAWGAVRYLRARAA